MLEVDVESIVLHLVQLILEDIESIFLLAAWLFYRGPHIEILFEFGKCVREVLNHVYMRRLDLSASCLPSLWIVRS
jgi:hypothetical protein